MEGMMKFLAYPTADLPQVVQQPRDGLQVDPGGRSRGGGVRRQQNANGLNMRSLSLCLGRH